MSQVNDKLNELSSKCFNLISLIEMTGIPSASFNIIRKKLLDIGNDILRLKDFKEEEGG